MKASSFPALRGRIRSPSKQGIPSTFRRTRRGCRGGEDSRGPPLLAAARPVMKAGASAAAHAGGTQVGERPTAALLMRGKNGPPVACPFPPPGPGALAALQAAAARVLGGGGGEAPPRLFAALPPRSGDARVALPDDAALEIAVGRWLEGGDTAPLPLYVGEEAAGWARAAADPPGDPAILYRPGRARPALRGG